MEGISETSNNNKIKNNRNNNFFYYFFGSVSEIIKIIILTAIIVVPIRFFVFQPFIVQGISMDPNFRSGDYLIVDEISYRFRPPQRGEVIVFKPFFNPSQRYIKRVIGLPGEEIDFENNKIIIKNSSGDLVLKEPYLPDDYQTLSKKYKHLVLGENEYFVLGDNREHSLDSRSFGPILKKDIIGRVVIRAWPFTTLAAIRTPAY